MTKNWNNTSPLTLFPRLNFKPSLLTPYMTLQSGGGGMCNWVLRVHISSSLPLRPPHTFLLLQYRSSIVELSGTVWPWYRAAPTSCHRGHPCSIPATKTLPCTPNTVIKQSGEISSDCLTKDHLCSCFWIFTEIQSVSMSFWYEKEQLSISFTKNTHIHTYACCLNSPNLWKDRLGPFWQCNKFLLHLFCICSRGLHYMTFILWMGIEK